MSSTNDMGLASERVRCSTIIDLHDLHCSTICEDVLWKPVACQQCETHFCLKCILKWLEVNPNQCPLRCESFVQRSCSKFIARQLAKLHIICIYHPNGCNEVRSLIGFTRFFVKKIHSHVLFRLFPMRHLKNMR